MAETHLHIDITNQPKEDITKSKSQCQISQEQIKAIVFLVRRFGLTLVKAAKIAGAPYHKVKKISSLKDPNN